MGWGWKGVKNAYPYTKVRRKCVPLGRKSSSKPLSFWDTKMNQKHRKSIPLPPPSSFLRLLLMFILIIILLPLFLLLLLPLPSRAIRARPPALLLPRKRQVNRAWRSAKRSGEPLRGKHGKGELGRRHDACALTNRPRKRSECIQEKHPVVFQKLGHFRFPGEGQRRTPAACVTGFMGAWQMQGKSE